jgi:two-component sensor histidine kinase
LLLSKVTPSVLVVEDNGVGMSKDIKGSGLGLHLLQGFSRAIDGKIDIRSTSAGTLGAVKFEAPSDHESPCGGRGTGALFNLS